jgi:hypothetical protein
MAKKRRLEVPRVPPVEAAEEDEGMGWKDWFLRDYARYWYWVGMGFLDLIIFFQTQWSFGTDWKVSLFFTGIAAVAQLYLYIRLWGEGGPLNRDE